MKRFNWTPSALTKLRKISKTHTMQQAADELNCLKTQVESACKRYKISFRKYGENHHSAKYSDHDVYLARELLDEGLSKFEIARKLEVPSHIVSDWCLNKHRNQDNVQC